jgi:hypothetical protein
MGVWGPQSSTTPISFEADLEHIAEEIDDMAKRERRSLHNRLARLIEYLLRWKYQPEKRRASWSRTIVVQRIGIQRLLDENPSLRPVLEGVAADAYADGARVAAAVTGRLREDFPAATPFTVEQLLDDSYPGARRRSGDQAAGRRASQ